MQILPFHSLALIAETHLSDVSFTYREEAVDASISPMYYVVAIVAVAAIALLIYYVINRGPAIVNTPLGMLHELCRTNRIKGRSRVVMEQIAEAAGLEHPAVMFLSRSRFDETVAAAKRKRSLDAKQTSTLGLVRRKLFASL